MRVCLFEDRAALDLEPLTLTRPVFELLCGQTALAAKQWRFFPPCLRGALVRPVLADLYRAQVPGVAVNDLAWLRAAPTILVNGRWLPPAGVCAELAGPCVGLVDGEVAYALLEPGQLAECSPNTLDDCLQTWKATLPQRPAGGRLFRRLWELVEHNGEQITRDWETARIADCGLRIADSSSNPQSAIHNPQSLAVVGPSDRLVIAPTAQLDPLVVIDTTRGPVVIDRKAEVRAFTRLEGPCYVGPWTQLHGAQVRGGTTLGPSCRVSGEVQASILQGYSNKAHDGFLGHSYLGEWVNVGAGTQASDLRNDYGEIRVVVNGELVRTGLNKVGCFLGDHTKTGIGALLNTGTNVGVCCGLLPGGLLPRYVPSFSVCAGGEFSDRTVLADLLHTAAAVMARRDCAFTELHAALFRALYEQTAAERRRVRRDAEVRALRRSA